MRWLLEWWLDRKAAFELNDYTARMCGLPAMVSRREAASFRKSGLTPREWYGRPSDAWIA